MITVHKALAENRKHLISPYTVTALAENSGISRATIHKIKYIPLHKCDDVKLSTLKKLYMALGLRVKLTVETTEQNPK